MLRRVMLSVLTVIFALIASSVSADDAVEFSDCHFHMLDFLQNGEFWNGDGKFPGDEWGRRGNGRYATLPFGERGRRVEALLRGMDRANVRYAMVCGMPFLKKWSENEPYARPRYYLDSSSQVIRARDTDSTVAAAIIDYRRQHEDDPGKLAELERISPFICGFDATDLGAVDLIVKRIKEYPGVWEGVGELMSRHDDLTNLTLGDRPRANHPSVRRICRFAGAHYLPVSIHHNIAPISRNLREVKQPDYLDEFVDLLRYCRRSGDEAEQTTRFIWCHAGISRRVIVDNLPYWIGQMLDEFEGQVYIDRSWVVLEDYINKDLDRWADLIEKYDESFMIGSDAVGGASKMQAELDRYGPLLKRLSPTTRKRLAKDNFRNLMQELAAKRKAAELGGQGIVLADTYEFPEFAHTGRLADDKSFLRSRRQRDGGKRPAAADAKKLREPVEAPVP